MGLYMGQKAAQNVGRFRRAVASRQIKVAQHGGLLRESAYSFIAFKSW